MAELFFDVELFFDGAIFEEVFQFGHEFLDVFEIHVDAGETDVGDFVELLEAMHDHFADFRGGQFPFGGFVDHAFDFIHDGFEFGSGNGALLASFQQPLQNFLALEAFAAAILLDHHVGNFVDALVSGEAAGAFQAFAAAADGVAGAAFAGINYLVVQMRAERTLHSKVSPLGTVRTLCVIGGGEARRGDGEVTGDREVGDGEHGGLLQIGENRDRGSSCLLAPPTPPYKRVRIRRFSELSPCGLEVRVVVRHKGFAALQVSVSASPSSEPAKLSRS